MLSREFYYRFEDEINRARYEINETYMGLAEVKARLAHIAGIDNLKVESTPRGDEIYTLGDVTATVPQGNNRDSMIYLAEKLANPFERETMSTPAPGSFAAGIRAMMDEARAGVAKAREDGLAKVGDAVKKLDEAKVATVAVAGQMAKTIENEAAEVMSELGQISNDLGGESQ